MHKLMYFCKERCIKHIPPVLMKYDDMTVLALPPPGSSAVLLSAAAGSTIEPPISVEVTDEEDNTVSSRYQYETVASKSNP